MVHVRIRPNGILQFDINIFGKRFRETTGLSATPNHLKKTRQLAKQMNAQIALATFDYRQYFPHSKKCVDFEQLKRAKQPAQVVPYFDSYCQQWLARQQHQWKHSYYRETQRIIRQHLLPHFAHVLMRDITLPSVLRFRAHLCALTMPDGSRRMANKRVNTLMVPLLSMVRLASDEYDFPYPLARLKMLREEKSDPQPLTKYEVARFLEAVPEPYRDYYIVRFFTGMRSCEIHALMPDCLDFENRLLKVRRNLVGKELSGVKTPKSRRDIYMIPSVHDALWRAVQAMKTNSKFVFTNHLDKPLSTHFIGYKIWYPTLDKIGIKRRPGYQTRHTCAVLHLAAHENPLYVSSLLGHSSTKMLFEVYAPYVHNAARKDGSAFERMMIPEKRP